LVVDPPSPPPPPPPAAPDATSAPPQAPASSASATRLAPLGNGRDPYARVMPVYDLALKLIEEDSEALKKEVSVARADQSAPASRFAVESGHSPQDVETKWRNEGDLDLLCMERVSQMNIYLIHPYLPSVLQPAFSFVTPETPSSNLRRRRSEPPEELEIKALVEAGDPPTMFTEFSTRTLGLHTTYRIGNQTYQNYLHWDVVCLLALDPNIPLSASHKGPVLRAERFIPGATDINDLPAPQYTYNQAAATPAGVPTSMALDIPVVADEERLGFDVRQFEVGEKEAVVWDESVAGIYKRFLGAQQEPVYGRPRRVDPYQEAREQLAQQSRYMK
ncbi:hypothetical protein BD626DRAFT_515023, partial [Schizophyllum amplum]